MCEIVSVFSDVAIAFHYLHLVLVPYVLHVQCNWDE